MTAPKLTPTPEQAAIIAAARTTKSNLLINALAGCAKTSTLVMLVRALPVQPTLCLAFNKRIATEMSERMPGHVQCSTLNALGHRSWQNKIGIRLNLKANKTGDLLKEYIGTMPKAQQRPLWDNFAALQRTIRMAKTAGVVPQGHDVSGLMFLDEFMESADDELSLDDREAASIVAEILDQSIRQSFDGVIDYDDQLYMSTLFGGQFPDFPLTLVDEAQDLSSLNHAMLRRIARRRLIAVGDPNQSIYGFRGAVANGMSALREDFSMEELGLSVTFRCPQRLVERARRHVPHFQWAEGAPLGEILDLRPEFDEGEPSPLWSAEGIPDGAAIICRNNAPLFRTALALIRAGRGVNLVGSDIGPQLIKALKGLGPETLKQQEVHDAIDKWEAARIKRKPSSEGATRDRADCLRVFADAGTCLRDSISFAERIFALEGPIQLLSGHKSKGLEWNTVYHLDLFRVPSRFVEPGTEAYRQELNVRYVIETRARERLILVNADDLA